MQCCRPVVFSFKLRHTFKKKGFNYLHIPLHNIITNFKYPLLKSFTSARMEKKKQNKTKLYMIQKDATKLLKYNNVELQ